MDPFPSEAEILAATKAWIEKDIIGLNLCPFAKPVHEAGQIRYVVSRAASIEMLLDQLAEELILLQDTDPAKTDTTLLIHPRVLADFYDYNDFLNVVDAAILRLGLHGIIQVASFHPQYQFADTEPDDPTNRTNRSPYPTLHLLREASIDKALETYPNPEEIPLRNIETMRRLAADENPPLA
jgi:hypothetical protein